PRIPRVNSANSQSPAANTGATGANPTNAAGPNNNSMYQNTNWTGQNSNANATNLLPTNSPTAKPTGLNSASPYSSIQSTNMNSTPHSNSGLQQAGATAPANGNSLLPIASSATNQNRTTGSIQPLNGPTAIAALLPPPDAVPSSTQRIPQAVSTQWGDKALAFPAAQPLLPTPVITTGPANSSGGPSIQTLPPGGN